MACSAPDDCARIERDRATGVGLLVDGGTSRGNLLSGEADEVILTVSRIEAEKRANPGLPRVLRQRLQRHARARALLLGGRPRVDGGAPRDPARRPPRGHRGGIYPFMRAAMCVIVRDLIVYGVLTDMMRGRPRVYATFSSYDEVAHHSGLERADTLEALRKLDQQFGRIDRARRYAPRPYEIVVLSDHGQTQGATFKQRNGYGLDELVERSLERGARHRGRRRRRAERDGRARDRRGDRPDEDRKRSKKDVSDRFVVVLGSGNLGLIYADGGAAPADARGDRRAPPAKLIPALARAPARRLAARPLGRARRRSRSARAARHYLAEGTRRGRRPAGAVLAERPGHLLRTDGFAHVADIMVGSFYDPSSRRAARSRS